MRIKIQSLLLAVFTSLILTSALSAEDVWGWKEIETIPAPYSNNTMWLDIYFLEENQNYGWACGFEGMVIRTTDGGASWAGAQIFIGNVDQLESIHFANEKIGYASGDGMIFKTTDGGATWFDVTPPSLSYIDIWGCFFITPEVGMAVGGGCSSNENQQFFRTTDGGASWSLFEGHISGTGLTDVMLHDANGLGYASSSGWIWRTLDGGKTWDTFSQTGDLDWQEEITNVDNSFLTPNSEGCSGGGGSGSMRFSTDGGASWKVRETDAPMFGTFLIDEQSGWACGRDRQIYYTSDGGLSWELQDCGIPDNVALDDIWFIDETNGWVAGGGVFKRHLFTFEPPVIEPADTVFMCDGEPVVLSASGEYSYCEWSTSERGKSIVVDEPGKYYVYGFVINCYNARSNTVVVVESERPTANVRVEPSVAVCEGEEIEIFVETDPENSVEFSTGESGTYTKKRLEKSQSIEITVWSPEGCDRGYVVDLTAYPNPKPPIDSSSALTFCVGDSVELFSSGGYSKYTWINASPPDTIRGAGERIIAKESGDYFLETETAEGCKNRSDTLSVSVLDLADALEFVQLEEYSEINLGDAVYPKVICKKFKILNNSDEDLWLDSPFLARNIAFSLPQSQFKKLVPARGEVEMTICYAPSKFGEERDTMFIEDFCHLRTIPLVAKGVAPSYAGPSRCDVPVKLKAKEISADYAFEAGSPYPNPTSGELALPVLRRSSDDFKAVESAYLADALGKILMRGKLKSISEINSGGANHFQGEYLFDMSELAGGAYFIIVKTPYNTFVYPATKLK